MKISNVKDNLGRLKKSRNQSPKNNNLINSVSNINNKSTSVEIREVDSISNSNSEDSTISNSHDIENNNSSSSNLQHNMRRDSLQSTERIQESLGINSYVIGRFDSKVNPHIAQTFNPNNIQTSNMHYLNHNNNNSELNNAALHNFMSNHMNHLYPLGIPAQVNYNPYIINQNMINHQMPYSFHLSHHQALEQNNIPLNYQSNQNFGYNNYLIGINNSGYNPPHQATSGKSYFN